QNGTVTESGGLNNWMIGGAMDVAPNLSVGVTLTYVSGSYRYDRDYHEQDVKGVYAYPFDFSDIRVQDFIEDDISGVNAKFGLMYRDPGRFRIGFSIKTPTSFSIKETYGTKATSTFRTPDKDGNTVYGPIDNPGSTDYDVHTPWVFGGGLSFAVGSLVLSGDAEYTDWTQTQFANANQDVLDQNPDFATVYKGTWNLRGGGELELPRLGVRLRGGFQYLPSIYKGDPKSFDHKYWTVGAGIPLGDLTMLDFGFAHGWWDTFRVNYDAGTGVPSPRVDEHVTANTYLLTLTHRF
ncbi:MAG TPA: outer membrane protein transport protein, partial [Bacteroidota bacterium]